jgi:predicted aspartyl protease
MRLVRGAIALLVGCGSPSSSGDAGSSAATVPIVVHDKFTAGLEGMLIPVRIGPPGSATAQLILDTGSSGIRILASALDPSVYQRTGTMLTETFDNGMVFDGEQATAIVAVGDAATPLAIDIEVVDSVSCAPSTPDCVAAAGASALTDVGTMGSFGVGLRGYSGSTLFSAIAQLPTAQQSYAIHLDSSGTTGSLAIGLGSDELASYQFVALTPDPSGPHPNTVPAWNDLGVPVCFAVAAAPVTQPCSAETLFDSGTTEVVLMDGGIVSTEIDGAGYLTAGTAFDASVMSVFDWATTATQGEIYVAPSSSPSFDRILGMPFFAAFDLAFDIQAGRIGIRAPQP